MTYCSGALSAGASTSSTVKPSRARYAPRDGRDVVRLVIENPLAWVTLADSEGPFATPVPFRPVLEYNSLVGLVGHVPRGSRIASCIAHSRQALIVVLGPNHYVSPSWISDRSQAPTWMYTSAQFVAELRIRDELLFLKAHLRDLSDAMEHGRANAWNVDEMGSRLNELSSRIVAVEATIKYATSRFKLGQDECDTTYAEIAKTLPRPDSEKLLAWMDEFNANRD